MNGEPIFYDPATDTLLVELRPWPSASPAEVNDEVGGEDVEPGLVVHYGLDGLPHAFEIEHASERPELVARALSALRHAKRLRRLSASQNMKRDDMVTARIKDDGTVVEILRDGSERPLVPEVDWARVDATTEAEIAAQIAADDAEAMRDAAAYARRVRRKIGLSQVASPGGSACLSIPCAIGSRASVRRKDPPGRCCGSSTVLRKRHFTLSTEIDC